MIKKIVILFCSISIFLTGCLSLDYTEPEKRAVVTALFMEKTEKFLLCAEVIELKENADKAFEVKYLNGGGESLDKAFKDLQTKYTKELSFYHCPIIICERKLFENSIEEISEYLINSSQLSLDVDFLIATDPFKLTEINPVNDFTLGYEITEQLALKGTESKLINIINGVSKPRTIYLFDKEFVIN